MPRDDWLRLAACAGQDLEWFDPEQAEACKAVCAECPVRQHCAEVALRWAEPWGIWGGLDPVERAEVAQVRDMQLPRILPAHGTNRGTPSMVAGARHAGLRTPSTNADGGVTSPSVRC